MNSDEVVQLYVSFPDSKIIRPLKALKGFKRINVPAGQSISISIPLNAEDLKYWSEERHAFVLEKGNVKIMLGAASDDLRLESSMTVVDK